ncbi:hypothetical protein J437_LFUL000008 [Ladona fulva]|uniref:Uncharacterized protein n=1 Tax=Ladona fulva TaxID=123851 RepID=A0A8K0JYK5_LADFU|nr:hypothetical protein J437_LFUL000008 [Ladona fulva]
MDSLERLLNSSAPIPGLSAATASIARRSPSSSPASSALVLARPSPTAFGPSASLSAVVSSSASVASARRTVVSGCLVSSRKSKRYLSGNFSLTGDTMEGIIQCLVFLKAFSVGIWCEWRLCHVLIREALECSPLLVDVWHVTSIAGKYDH